MCFFKSVIVYAHLSYYLTAPGVCHTDQEICKHMAEVGCQMVDECYDKTKYEEEFEACLERSLRKCS